MATRPYPILTVNEKAARAIRAGHPWVYGVETVSYTHLTLPTILLV